MESLGISFCSWDGGEGGRVEFGGGLGLGVEGFRLDRGAKTSDWDLLASILFSGTRRSTSTDFFRQALRGPLETLVTLGS